MEHHKTKSEILKGCRVHLILRKVSVKKPIATKKHDNAIHFCFVLVSVK